MTVMHRWGGGDRSPGRGLTPEMADLAIIGGGAAAATMLAALAHEPGAGPISVLWVAPEGEDGRGVAYRTQDPAHRLNVRAERMSLRADRPGDFVEFLAAANVHADPRAFMPRRSYGEYLSVRAAESARSLGAQRWPVRAVSAYRDHGWRIGGSDGQWRRASHLVLALGPEPMKAPAVVDAELLARGIYRVDPYAWVEQPRSPGALKQVWILGSGLTAVDLALTVASVHPGAQIHLLSRHGALPASHTDAAPAPDPLAPAATFPPISRLLRDLRACCRSAVDWRGPLDGLRAGTADRWQRWSASEQRRFLRHARWAWDRARHRMAPEVARAVSALRTSGQLHVHRGRLLAAENQNGAALIQWRPRGLEERHTARADLVLQATGLDTSVSASSTPLLRSLLDQGLACPDPLDLGLAVDPAQRLLDAQGRVDPQAHVLGALARGCRFECIAIPEIRTTAATIAAGLRASRAHAPAALAPET